jgi:hypothetical protein
LPDVIAAAQAALRGADIRGTLLWRYTLVWRAVQNGRHAAITRAALHRKRSAAASLTPAQ